MMSVLGHKQIWEQGDDNSTPLVCCFIQHTVKWMRTFCLNYSREQKEEKVKGRMRREDCNPQTARGRAGLKDNTVYRPYSTSQPEIPLHKRLEASTKKHIWSKRQHIHHLQPVHSHCAAWACSSCYSSGIRLQSASACWEKCPDGGHRSALCHSLTDSSVDGHRFGWEREKEKRQLDWR